MPRLFRLFGLREDDVAVGDRHRAGRHRLWRFLDLDEAHPAIAGDVEAFVVAEMRDLDPGQLARLEDRRAGRDLQFRSVDRHLGHQSAPRATSPSPPFRGEREGPGAKRWEGEVGIGKRSGIRPLTPTLSPGGGEGVEKATAGLAQCLALWLASLPGGRNGHRLYGRTGVAARHRAQIPRQRVPDEIRAADDGDRCGGDAGVLGPARREWLARYYVSRGKRRQRARP